MHAASNGCYRVENIAIENELVVTNSTPVGLNRGYGGPQFYFALERIMDIAARGLNIDPAELRRRNFIASDAFPYRTPAGAVLDAGDYDAALTELLRLAGYEGLQRRREEARRAGKLYGIGIAAGIEPSGSNMAYISLAQTRAGSQPHRPQVRRAVRAPSFRSIPAARSLCACAARRTVRATRPLPRRSWPMRSGLRPTTSTSSPTSTPRPAPGRSPRATIPTALLPSWSMRSPDRLSRSRHKVRLLAAQALDASPQDIELADGYARVRGKSNKGMPFRKVAARAHWDPAGLPAGAAPGIHEIAVVSPRSARIAR